MWDPSVGAGTVPHQNIGYLFPLGPYYWLMEAIGSPDWLTQRLLWGTMVFAAAYGTYRMARWLGWTFTGALVAACAYGFSPYLLSYLARLSVILGPWAAMPWMVLLAAKAARTRSWKPAAQFAVVVALVGSVNATSLVLAGLGPVIWLATDVAAGRVRLSAAVRGAVKIAVLSAAVSVWWIVALRIQGTYGIPILRYTETYGSVASCEYPGRDRPRPRLLVLLRWRPTRPVGRTRRTVLQQPDADRTRIHDRRHRSPRLPDPVRRPSVGRRPAPPRPRSECRSGADRCVHALRHRLRVVRDRHDGRACTAVDPTCGPTGHLRPGARGRRELRVAEASDCRAPIGRGGRGSMGPRGSRSP